MARTLKYAPKEDVARYGVGRGAGSRLINVPTPEGGFDRFRVVESSIMDPKLAAKFPDIKTYAGVGIDDPAASIRLDLTPLGFHAQVLTPAGEGAYYVDPYFHNDQSVYASYYKIEANNTHDVAADHDDVIEGMTAGLNAKTPHRTTSNGAATVSLRTYRAAVAATGEYTAFHGGTVAAGQAAIVTAMNRVTGIYETELAVRMVLVANNNLLVYTNAGTDPYTNNDPNSLVTENQSNVKAVIGSANYDIGHVFSTAGGGLAGLGVVGADSVKARGETGVSAPVGDPFYVDYVAHEMGHQFGATHTFNTSTDANRSAANAYEPGSGSTIMGYAGITGDDLQPNSDPYFAWRSIDEILTLVDVTRPTIGTRTATTNAVPTVSGGPNYTIPINTPFALTATGSDPNGDTVYYSWEEADAGTAATLEQGDVGNNPIFRVYNPTTSPTRTFPILSTILAGLGQTPGSEGPVEVLPTTSRAMKFYPVVRDKKAGAGGTNVTTGTFVTVTSVAAANAFQITNLNTTTVNLVGGSTQSVNWNVAGTTANGINTANVQILMGTDGGQTFPTVLASSTVNDGTENVVIPNINSSSARFKVAAVGNIFFDINNTSATITASATPTKVTAVTIDSGTSLVQRSRVRSATVLFDGIIPNNGVLQGAFTLTQTSGAIASYSASIASITYPTAASTSIVLNFLGAATVGGSVADGRYTLTVNGNSISNTSGIKVDAAGTGVAGSVRNTTFHRLFGDVDGDAGVSINDFNAFATAFATTGGTGGFNPYFDYDNDNGISINDFNQFATRFGVTI